MDADRQSWHVGPDQADSPGKHRASATASPILIGHRDTGSRDGESVTASGTASLGTQDAAGSVMEPVRIYDSGAQWAQSRHVPTPRSGSQTGAPTAFSRVHHMWRSREALMRRKKSPVARSTSPSQAVVRSALRSTATLQSSLREVRERVDTMQQSQMEAAEQVRAQTLQSLGELRRMMDQDQVRQQSTQQSIAQLRAGQTQQEVNVATLQRSLHDFRHDATQRSVAQDLSARTSQYSTCRKCWRITSANRRRTWTT